MQLYWINGVLVRRHGTSLGGGKEKKGERRTRVRSRKKKATNLLGEFDAVDGEEPVAERVDGAVSRESRGPLWRGLAGLGDGARGEQRHVAAAAGAGP